jgi:multiple antibiotic resistance protein
MLAANARHRNRSKSSNLKRQKMALFFSIALSLFLLMDPVGNVPIFCALLKDIDPLRSRKIIVREMVIALGVMLAFYFMGEALLAALHVNKATVQIAGGIILFLIAVKMVFPSLGPSGRADAPAGEPFIVPMAIPLVAGPSTLVAIMLYASSIASNFIVIGAMVAAWAGSALILLGAPWLNKWLGARGLTACERLMGLVMTMIAVQMLLEGLDLFLQSSNPATAT